jgi:hypothetical protein
VLRVQAKKVAAPKTKKSPAKKASKPKVAKKSPAKKVTKPKAAKKSPAKKVTKPKAASKPKKAASPKVNTPVIGHGLGLTAVHLSASQTIILFLVHPNSPRPLPRRRARPRRRRYVARWMHTFR